MRKYWCVILLSLSLNATAQETLSDQEESLLYRTACPAFYVGISHGLNNPAGVIGANIDVPVAPKVSVSGGAGFGTWWGVKLYAEARYYLKPCHRGWAVGIGISRNTGAGNFSTTLGTPDSQPITCDVFPVTCTYAGIYHFWTVGERHNRFYLNAGYSLTLGGGNHYDDWMLDADQKKYMDRYTPGGLMVGVGYYLSAYVDRSSY